VFFVGEAFAFVFEGGVGVGMVSVKKESSLEAPADEAAAPSGGELVVYQADDGRVKVDVRLQDESVWLTPQMMTALFQTSRQNIILHISNIYEEGELLPEATCTDFLPVRQEGGRTVQRAVEHYNLDMIISRGLPGQEPGGHALPY
jgi:hypothetical protein